jgi:PHD/YefM family antitoxin component YafN of YafNO toxin-antitoxin module
MPTIRPSADLRNNYNEISAFCHQYDEPVYITKNGRGDLAVLSIEAYEMLCGKLELHQLLMEGLKAEKEGLLYDADAVFSEIASRIPE